MSGVRRRGGARRIAARAVGAVVVGVAWVLGPVWVWAYQRKFGRGARGLTAGEREVFARFFSAELLERVRVAEVERIRLGGEWVSRARRVDPVLVSEPAGLTLDWLIVVAREAPGREGSGREGPERMSLLFHELVHVAQFRALGVRGFVRRYVGGWVRGGFSYLAIPLEEEAFALQGRFVAWPGSGFDVEGEIRSRVDRIRH